MEVYEKINEILREKKLSKKSFSQKVIELEPKLRNTGGSSNNKCFIFLLKWRCVFKS